MRFNTFSSEKKGVSLHASFLLKCSSAAQALNIYFSRQRLSGVRYSLPILLNVLSLFISPSRPHVLAVPMAKL